MIKLLGGSKMQLFIVSLCSEGVLRTFFMSIVVKKEKPYHEVRKEKKRKERNACSALKA